MSSKEESTATRPPPRRAKRPPRAVAQVPQVETRSAVPSEAVSVHEEKPAPQQPDDEVRQATEMMAAAVIDEAEEPPSEPCAHCGKHGCSARCARCRAVYYCSQAQLNNALSANLLSLNINNRCSVVSHSLNINNHCSVVSHSHPQ